MALPIWAHARGQLYPFVAMNDGMEDELVDHENTSSPEPYFCRPMALGEIVDAVTCPSGQFRSAKGLLDPTQPQSYYPPRADLFNFGGAPCIARIGYPGSCDPGDSAQYFALDDVDVVAAATPPYGRSVHRELDRPCRSGERRLRALRRGGQGVRHQRRPRPSLRGDGAGHEVLQRRRAARERRPAVGSVSGPVHSRRRSRRRLRQRHRRLWRLERSDRRRDAARRHDQQRSWQRGGAPAALRQRRERSGAGVAHARRLSIRRLHGHAGARSAPRLVHRHRDLDRERRDASGPAVERKGGPAGRRLRRALRDPAGHRGDRPVGVLGLDPGGGAGGRRARDVDHRPARRADARKASTAWESAPSVSVAARRRRSRSSPRPRPSFAKLSGCFIATAAFGSDLAPEVATLRLLRDAATSRSALATTAVDLYYRSSPPLARTLARSPVGRALVRTALRSITR